MSRLTRSVTIKLNPENVLSTTTYAATRDTGPFPSGIPYPLLHTLIYFLEHNGLELGYIFNWYFFLKEDLTSVGRESEINSDINGYPNSSGLAEAVYDLEAATILNLTRGSGLIIQTGPLFRLNMDSFIRRFEEVSPFSFTKLTELTDSAFKDLQGLLDLCYKWYVNEL